MELPFPIDWFSGDYALGLFVLFFTWGVSRVWMVFKNAAGAFWHF